MDADWRARGHLSGDADASPRAADICQPGDREEARDLLHLALQAADELRIPEAGEIRAILSEHGLDPPKEDGP